MRHLLRTASQARGSYARAVPRRGAGLRAPGALTAADAGLREPLVQRVALDDRLHALGELRRASSNSGVKRDCAMISPTSAKSSRLEAARGQRRRADPQAGGLHRRARIERDRVAVDGDADLVQAVLGLPAAQLRSLSRRSTSTRCTSVPPVSTAHAVAGRRSSACGERLRAPSSVRRWRSRKQLARGDLQRDGLGGDHVLQRAALLAGEHRRVDLLRVLLLAEDHPGARAAERLVGRRRDDVGAELDRVRVQARGDQAGEVRHVDHQQRADLVGDLAEAREVELARIGRPAGEQQLRAVLARDARDLVHVDQAGLAVDLVGGDVVEAAGDVDLHAVREVAAVGERQAHDRVAGLQQRVVDGGVRLRAGVRLDVRVLGAEQRLRAVDRELLGDVDPLAAAVVAAARIALGVLVGQHRALAFEHRARHEVLRGDQLERALLALELAAQRLGDLGVDLRERAIEVVGAELGHGALLGRR